MGRRGWGEGGGSGGYSKRSGLWPIAGGKEEGAFGAIGCGERHFPYQPPISDYQLPSIVSLEVTGSREYIHPRWFPAQHHPV